MAAASAAVAAAAVLLASLGAGAARAAYSEDEGKVYMQYARASTCTRRSIERWDCGEMCDVAEAVPGRVRFLGDGEDQAWRAYVAQRPRRGPAVECVVAVRGSVNFLNFLHDAEFWQVDWPNWAEATPAAWCPGCRVHGGFAAVYLRIRRHMFEAVRDLGCQRLSFTGHSLGGALVTLASMEARGEGLRVGPVWTFGKPRVGNRAFAEAYAAAAARQGAEPPMWRIVHYHDVVPRLPPMWVPGYVHEPTEVYYTTRASSAFEVCESSLDLFENRSCSWSLPFFGCLGSGDHNEYLNITTERASLPAACIDDVEGEGEADEKTAEAAVGRPLLVV